MKSFVLVNKSSAGTELIVERAHWKILHNTAFNFVQRNTVLYEPSTRFIQQQWKRYIYTSNRPVVLSLVIHPDCFVILVILLSEDELNLLLTVIKMRCESFNHLSSAIVAI